MAKFKIGQTVIGNDLASRYYSITKKGYVAFVTDVPDDSSIKIESVSHPSEGFVVSASAFDLFKYGEEK